MQVNTNCTMVPIKGIILTNVERMSALHHCHPNKCITATVEKGIEKIIRIINVIVKTDPASTPSAAIEPDITFKEALLLFIFPPQKNRDSVPAIRERDGWRGYERISPIL